MNITINPPSITMSSREIAELTGKEHKNVKRDVEKMLNELGEDALKFEHIYLDSMNREQTEYRLDRDLTETLLLGYSAPLRLKVVRRLRELEAQARPLSTAETLIQMLQLQVDIERQQAEQTREIRAIGSRLDSVEDTAPLKVKPQNSETISEIRKRIGRKYGLPERIINEVMTKLPHSPRPFAMVKNSNENAQGSSFAVYQIADVTKLFAGFVSECTPTTKTTYTHPMIDGRFKMKSSAEAATSNRAKVQIPHKGI